MAWAKWQFVCDFTCIVEALWIYDKNTSLERLSS